MLVARKASCCVTNAFSTGLKVIWPTSNNNNNTFISPHNIQEIKNFITAVQTMIGALAARNNLRVKNARQPVKRKDV